MISDKVEESLILDPYVTRRATRQRAEECEQKKKKDSLKRVSGILRKCETLRTPDENRLLEQYSDIAKEICQRKERIQRYKDRAVEKEDPTDVIERKAKTLADVISRSRHLVCYTGAGISTSARIPDYRGSQGIWTLLQKGQDIGQYDLSLAEPTYTHMALHELHRRQMLRFVVSQNCDGLHLRSGLPRKSLSEVHGNMYIEVCKHCKPNCEYWRLFDTTEFTARYYHKTNRRCYVCGKPLTDTIVHFGERGNLKWPLNWDGACTHADKADVILCLGSSLKVLKRYSWLWAMDRPKKKRPKLYIVNLQWTPKDDNADIKINGKCDEVMRLVMQYLCIKVPAYDRVRDPIFAHASALASAELHTVSQPMLRATSPVKPPDTSQRDEASDDSSRDTDICLDLRTSSGSFDCSAPQQLVPQPTIADLHTVLKTDDCSSSNFTKTDWECDEPTDLSLKPVDMSIAGEIGAVIKAEPNTSAQHQMSPAKRQMSELLSSISVMDEAKVKNHNNYYAKIGPFPMLDGGKLVDDEMLTKPLKCEVNNENEPPMNRTPADGNEPPTDGAHARLYDLFNVNGPKIPDQDTISNLLTQTICDNKLSLNRGTSVAVDVKNYANTLKMLRRSQDWPTEATPSPPAFACNADYSYSQVAFVSDDDDDASSSNDYYKSFLDYYKEIERSLPYWYDVNYAYSGLHSIIHPPPTESDPWATIIIPIFQLNRKEAECEFCFDNYAEYTCQFYRGRKAEFPVSCMRNGRMVICECCDHTDQSESELSTNVDVPLTDEAAVGQPPEWTADDGAPAAGGDEKRAKLELFEPPKVQAGWYGKGCRKNRIKKKKNRNPLT